MSLDIWLEALEPVEVWSANITHNLTGMAKEVGIYQYLWHPEEVGVTKAENLIVPLQNAIELLHDDVARYTMFNSPNGWGSYADFVSYLKKFLAACVKYPDATVHVSI